MDSEGIASFFAEDPFSFAIRSEYFAGEFFPGEEEARFLSVDEDGVVEPSKDDVC
jgi:hypothetical protein